jgi:two-component system response regulator GlrR
MNKDIRTMTPQAFQKIMVYSCKTFRESKQEFERIYLVELMTVSRGNVSRAAKLAGKYRADLYALLEKCKLDPLQFRED